MRDRLIKILLVEDNVGDVRLLQELLSEAEDMRFELTVADRIEAAQRALDETTFDVILLDLSLPDSRGVETLLRLRPAAPEIPIIVLTGMDDEGLGIDLVQAGAQDYLIKGKIEPVLLARSLRYAIERNQADLARRWAEQRYRRLFEDAPAMYILTRNQDGVPIITDCNRAFLETLGYSRDEVIGRSVADFYTPASRALLLEGGYQRALTGQFGVEERQLVARDGRVIEALLRAVPEYDAQGRVVGTRAMFVDVTEHRRTEEVVRRQWDELAARDRILNVTLQTLDLDRLLNHILEEIIALLDVEFGCIHLVQQDQAVLRTWWGLSDDCRAHLLAFPTREAPSWMWTPVESHERIAEEGGRIPAFLKREGVQAWATVPLNLPAGSEAAGEWLGTIMVGSHRYRALDQRELRALRGMAGLLALAIDHARAYRQAQERLTRLETLRAIDRAIIQYLDLQDVLRVVLEGVPPALGADAIAVSLLDEEREQFQLFAIRLPNGSIVEDEAFTLADSLLHWFVERKEPVVIYDLSLDPRVQMHRDRIRTGPLVSYLGVPLVVREQTIGILHVLTTRPKVFTDEDVAFFRTLAGQAAVAIENARMFAAAQARAEAVEAMLAAQLEIASHPLEEVGATILETLRDCVGATQAAFFHYDERTQTLALKDAIGFPEEVVTRVRPHLVFRLGQERGLVGLVAFTRRSLYLPDCDADPRWIKAEPRIRSAYLVPLVFGDRLFGLIELISFEPHAFPIAQRTLADLFAHYVGAALENARLLNETRQRAAHLEALNAVIAAATAAENLPDLLQTAIDHTLRALGLSMGTIWVRGEPPVVRGLPARDTALTARIIRSADVDIPEVVVVRDWLLMPEEAPYDVFRSRLVHRGVRATVAAPILAEGQRIGGLIVASPAPRDWRPEEIALVEAVGRQLGATVERLQLLRQTQRRLQEVAFLSRIIAVTASAANQIDALGDVCLELAHYFHVTRAAFVLADSERSSAEVVAIALSSEHPEGTREIFSMSEIPPIADALEGWTPLVIPDAQNDPRLAPILPLLQQRGVVSLVLIPVLVEGETIGTLSLGTAEPRQWSPEELRLMEDAARQVGQMLERLRSVADLRDRVRLMSRLATLGEMLNRPNTVDEVAAAIGQGVMALSGADRAAVYMERPDGTAECLWSQGLSDAYLQQVTGLTPEMARALPVRQLVERAAPILVSDITQMPEDSFLYALSVQEGYRAVALWPLIYEGQVVAGVCCYYDAPHVWSDAEREVMDAFTRQAAVSLENARLYTAMQQMNEELQVALRLRDEMVQNVSHELRTPLALIKGYIELMYGQMLGALNPQQADAVNVLRRQTDRLHYMVNRLLTLQTLSTSSVKKIPLDINTMLREFVQAWRARAAEARVQLELQLAADLPTVMVDPNLLEELMINLLDNAIKFSPEGGTVTVRTWLEEEREVHLSISDQGIGIPPDKLERVFDRFYQVDGSSSRRFGGMGIGLTLCRGIVELHGGRIWAESAGEGRGATFHVCLPLTEP